MLVAVVVAQEVSRALVAQEVLEEEPQEPVPPKLLEAL